MYDLAVIGGGPGGYVAAIRAAKKGLKTIIIEKDFLGGTCLNTGCIPSKALLRHAEIIEDFKQAEAWGIEADNLRFDWRKMFERQQTVVKQLRQGVASLMKKNKIEVHEGVAELKNYDNGKWTVALKDSDSIQASHVILATGSKPIIPPIPGVKECDPYTTETIFSMENLPDSMLIVGGGIIGVELATAFASVNVKVSIVEMADRLVPTEDYEASDLLRKKLEQLNVQIFTGTSVESFQSDNTSTTKSFLSNQETIETESVLVAAGRSPNTSVLGEIKTKLENQAIYTSDTLETSLPNVYAVGDVNGRVPLAHTASAEGLTAIENILGASPKKKMNYKTVPRVIYTLPEIASIGWDEKEAEDAGFDVKTSKINFHGNGRALTAGQTDGFVKLIADKKYGEILGITMVGSHVTEMISEGTAFMELEGTVYELADTVHPHPTLSETMMEAANSWLDLGVHE
ncbi:dihydrolipoyl dehydrogenase [Alkalicoccus saliphilus]|uniref:Dihydrolipoyl dehydrogenase n=1 Tax=Alkalicoccus saliphilus TaxID=200989 RepID=A0A2T4U284_9BACI|nr:dihydrolipoyl dehydrogenase [Alkalicoccus saliphilus]PTL37516.1 dihydrolipoyl dehydrogenase [Alkalicoccus saliphilus]